MPVFGDKEEFAIEIRVHPESEKNINRAFGCFRYWVLGRAFGMPDDDATLFGAIISMLALRLAHRGTLRSPFERTASNFEVLNDYYTLVYARGIETDEEEARVRQWNKLLLAPNGNAAFDDCSYVIAEQFDEILKISAGRCVEIDDEGNGGMGEDVIGLEIAAGRVWAIFAQAIHYMHVELPKET